MGFGRKFPVGRWQKSPWVLHFNSGGCNGCDIEILDLLTPRYDVERLGIRQESVPRHADILLCTGPVTRQSRDRLHQIYTQMPERKMGDCCGELWLFGRRVSGERECAGWCGPGYPGGSLYSRLPLPPGDYY